MKINEHFLQLKKNYLFVEIGRRIAAYQNLNPNTQLYRLGIGDVVLPLSKSVISALHYSVDEMADCSTFKGYGPEQGYRFLTERIAAVDFKQRGMTIDPSEIFMSDGAKSDIGNFQDILDSQAVIAVTDPVYPVYVDTNLMAGRKILYLPCNVENDFVPDFPKEPIDIIYLCYPNNPTGATISATQLQRWVDFAIEKQVLILYDAAYEAYISDVTIPHSIFEIEGAQQCAVEFRSFSKNAGFTGTRLGYTVVPKAIKCWDGYSKNVSLNELWNRRQSTKFNGVPYIIQKAGEALYTESGQQEIRELVSYYMENARVIRERLTQLGFTVYGGINAPYIWLKTPEGTSSWDFFDQLLSQSHVIGTPGEGFGMCGKEYFRLSAFGFHDQVKNAMDSIAASFPFV